MGAECAGADAFFNADYFAAIEAVGGGGEERVAGCVAGAGAEGWGFVVAGVGRAGLDFEGADGGVLEVEWVRFDGVTVCAGMEVEDVQDLGGWRKHRALLHRRLR